MRTDAEIHERVKAIKDEDFFGFEQNDLLAFLPFEEVQRYVKPDMVEQVRTEWQVIPRDRDYVINVIKDYMPFAWEKASYCRSISASRSISHMSAWLWLIGEDELADKIKSYTHYGKPQLRAICEHFGWDWKQWDDGLWRNSENASGVSPEQVDSI